MDYRIDISGQKRIGRSRTQKILADLCFSEDKTTHDSLQ